MCPFHMACPRRIHSSIMEWKPLGCFMLHLADRINPLMKPVQAFERAQGGQT